MGRNANVTVPEISHLTVFKCASNFVAKYRFPVDCLANPTMDHICLIVKGSMRGAEKVIYLSILK